MPTTINWVMVYSSAFAHKVEIVKSLLEENEIDCVIMNKQDSSYLFGEIELHVKDTDVLEAKQIILTNEIE